MPIYEYRCLACEQRFEVLTVASRVHPSKVSCPRCEGKGVERVWSRVAVGTGRKGYHPAEPLDV